ncbi:low temperature requirement protein A [Streptomyces sp. ML-6]|uniref:low temperature requirement protein A n=1 Tax=Streptomyces sp. ML-6 TaxID=2982693 RepID=UPI0024C00118|nr:low temperature requirement protein A [Streptomyces sp. ML-6]MDK0520071.1 low temperature requirement protein A [Streptomyces sp. ML-6]
MPVMTARSRTEKHRASTPLELFFDLCFVVAVAQAGGRLVHAVAEGHALTGIGGYAAVFFAIWWAWVNFSWFASAYDTDDPLYRVVTLVQITGVLVLAAGVPRAFDANDWTVVVIGYVVMRLALTSQWLRAAYCTRDSERRVALRYAVGIMVVQVGWIAMLALPDDASLGVRVGVFVVLVLAETAVPLIAERDRSTSWHPHHIGERYGLFTIIVLGETIAAATVAVQEALDEHDALGELLPIAAGGLLIVFSAWWIYFAVPIHAYLRGSREAFVWGYGHYLIFGSAAAIGAGIEVTVEEAVGKAHVPTEVAAAAVTVPSALFMLTVWALHARHFKRDLAEQLPLPVAALAILACTFVGSWAVFVAGLVAAATVAASVLLSRRPEVAG